MYVKKSMYLKIINQGSPNCGHEPDAARKQVITGKGQQANNLKICVIATVGNLKNI